MAVKVGTFQKSVAAAPAVQQVTGVGFKPKALILWSTAQVTLDTWEGYIRFAMGMTDGTTSRSGCCTMEHGVGTTNTTRYWSSHIYTNYWSGLGVLNQGDLTSFDNDGFTLTWTINQNAVDYIHYIAIGGDDLTNVALVPWTCTTGAGNVSVATAGFQPDLCIHLGSYSTAIDVAQGEAYLGFGAMDSGGRQFGAGGGAYDNAPFGYGCSAETADCCYCLGGSALIPSIRIDLRYVSMDANGFTISKNTPPGSNVFMATLCLKGGGYYVGAFDEANAVGNQSVGGLPFTPEGVLFFSDNLYDAGGFPLAAASDTTLNVGAMDRTDQASASYINVRGVDPTQAKSFCSSSACITTGTSTPATTDQAVAVSLDPTGFTVNWTTQTNDVNDYGYIAFDTGPYTPPIPPFIVHDILFVTPSVGYVAVKNSDGVGEVWRTIDGGYSWHILPDAYGSMPIMSSINQLAKCSVNRILAGAEGITFGTILELGRE